MTNVNQKMINTFNQAVSKLHLIIVMYLKNFHSLLLTSDFRYLQ